MPITQGQHCVIFDDVQIGEGTRIGNFVFIRSNTQIGIACTVGSYVDIEGDVVIGKRQDIGRAAGLGGACRFFIALQRARKLAALRRHIAQFEQRRAQIGQVLDPAMGREGFDWAHRFDDAARELMTSAPGDVASLATHPDYAKAVPTADHFLPLLYVAGLAAAADTPAEVMIDGYGYGSLSMTAYTVG